MQYCSNCGKEILQDAAICLSCGCMVQAELIPPVKKDSRKVLTSDVLVLNIVSLVLITIAVAVLAFAFIDLLTATENVFNRAIGVAILAVPAGFVLLAVALGLSAGALRKTIKNGLHGKAFAIINVVVSAITILAITGYDIWWGFILPLT